MIKQENLLKKIFSAFGYLKKILFIAKLPTELLFKSRTEYVCFDKFLYRLKAFGKRHFIAPYITCGDCEGCTDFQHIVLEMTLFLTKNVIVWGFS